MIVPPDRYFVRREPQRSCEGYWEPRRDPDGELRDRMLASEERQYLEDVAEELEFISSLNPFSVLDVGCGPGWFLSALPGCYIAGTEVCHVAIAEAKRRGIQIIASLADCKSEAYTVVRCHHVIEHMDDPGAELDEMRRVCRKWLVISTPDFGSPCAVRFGSNYRMLCDDTHCSLFTNESMHRFLRDGGWTIQRVTYPFPDRYATSGTLDRWRDVNSVSPPFPGNWLTFYCTKG